MELNEIKDLELQKVNNKNLFNELFYLTTALLDFNDFEQYVKVVNYIYSKRIENKGE